jgi:hypothetical protein
MERPKRQPLSAGDSPHLSSHSRLRTAAVDVSADYAAMRDVLLRYLSPVLVDSVLSRSLHSHRLSAQTLNKAQLAELTSDVMVGLRLFVPEERLSQLMLDLAEILETE